MQPIDFDDATWNTWWRDVSPAKKLSQAYKVKKFAATEECWFALWEEPKKKDEEDIVDA